jgi:hypothetical protein
MLLIPLVCRIQLFTSDRPAVELDQPVETGHSEEISYT